MYSISLLCFITCACVKNRSVGPDLPTALPGEEAQQREVIVMQAQLLQLH